MVKSFVIFLFLLFTAPALQLKAQEQQVVPFTLADRDRIARTEMKLDALQSKIDTRFEALESKMETKLERSMEGLKDWNRKWTQNSRQLTKESIISFGF